MIEYKVRVYNDGTREWFLNGKRHREEGPAFERNDGYKAWYIKGRKLTEEEFNRTTNGKELTITEIEELLGYTVKIVKEKNND